MPSSWACLTVQPPDGGAGAVTESGSDGCDGVGVGQVSCGRTFVVIAGEPVTASRSDSDVTFLVSQVKFRQPRPKACSMLLSVE